MVGIETEREATEALLRSFSFEKLLLGYHDLYRPLTGIFDKRERARGATHRAEMFMHNVCEWFEGGYDKMAPEDRRSLLFIWNRDILEKSETPLAALHHFPWTGPTGRQASPGQAGPARGRGQGRRR